MSNKLDLKKQVEANLHSFLAGDFKQNALQLFDTLGYKSDKQINLQPNTAEGFKSFLKENNAQLHNEAKAHLDEWLTVDFLFQLTDEETSQHKSLFDSSKIDTSDKRIESYLFFAIKLKNNTYSRSVLAEITREINLSFPMPVMLLFHHGNTLTFSIIDRRLHKRDGTKDVLHKITLIKDIRLENLHRAHIDILSDLSLENLNVKNFVELHNAWQKVLDTKELNKKFFQELANWYFWAIDNVEFPADEEKNAEVRNATSVIRLITRLMFVWFLKEKGLVSEKLFDEKYLKTILRFKDDSTFYKAVLQNLFFATLNSEMNKREFITESSGNRNSQHFVHNVFRYKGEFIKPEETIKELFDPIPFLNGGLFECLDKETEVDGTKCRIRVDGFSDNKKNVLKVPDELFLGAEREIDLSGIYDDKKKTKSKVRGLINILNSYKFTIAENTPIEEEIALDPELLGKVFENLLASYNPETRTTARKQTGSFYTPREVVNYIVDESLIVYLKAKLQTETEGFSGYVAFGENQPTMFGNEMRKQMAFEMPLSNNRWHGKNEELQSALRDLFNYTETTNKFNETETEILIKAIDDCKILDPACGSGAFPMGILQRLVFLLKKLDIDNTKWREWQEKKAKDEAGEAFKINDKAERNEKLKEISDVFENNASDYGRKLFLIENCIYGVDIQAIAIQIAKLRFFISLIVDEKVNPEKENLGIRPLPNLETKFVAADTLLSLEEAQGSFAKQLIKPKENELREIRAKHFNARYRQDKEKFRRKDFEIRREIADILEQQGFNTESAEKIARWNPYDQNASADWFDFEYMFGIEDGFDIVIGNPPYVQMQKDNGQLAKLYAKENYQTFERTGDVYSLFYEQGNNLLKKQGILCFITSNKWMRSGYGESTRKYFSEHTNPLQLIDFAGQKIFESATVDTNILLFSKDKNQQKTLSCIVKEKVLNNLSYFVRQIAIARSFNSKESWIILDPIEQRIKAKIEKLGTPLRDWDIDIYRGVLTGFNEAFIIDGKKKDELIAADPKSAEVIRPILKGRDIKRYSYDFADSWLLFVPWHFPLHKDPSIKGASQKAEKAFKAQYPEVYNHLLQYKTELLNRNRAETGIRYEWYAMQRWGANYSEDFSKQKIVWKRIGSILRFSFDECGMLALDSTCFATGKDVKFLVAVLNSKTGKYLMKDAPKTGTGDLLISVQAIEPLKIPIPSPDIAKSVEESADSILHNIKHGLSYSKLESEIEQTIFKLYDFSDEEIRFIETQ